MTIQYGRISITDRDGVALIMDRTQGGLYASVREASGGGTSTAGPFVPERVRAALDAVAPAGSYARPDGAEELEALIDRASLDGKDADNESLADYLAARLIDQTVKDS